MRILLVTRRYWPAVGGVESFLRDLALELGQRHDVKVLAHRVDDGPSGRLTDSLRPPPVFPSFKDGPVEVLPLQIAMGRRALMAPLVSQVVPVLRRYAYGRIRGPMAALYARVVAPLISRAAREADVVHVFGSDLLAAAAVRAGRLVGVPVVITPFAHRGQWGDDPASAAVYSSADRVVALLEAEGALYRQLGVPEERMSVCGVCSPGVATGGGGALRSEFGITGPLVLFVGVRRPYKGVDLLVEAAPIVAREQPDVTFAFVGPGPRLAATGTHPRILDIGSASARELAAWLDAADLLCLPSAGEIFPVSVLEAWSVGTPVLTSDLPTLTELVGGTGGGDTVRRDPQALAGAIVRLLGDTQRRHAMGEAGRRRWAERYTPRAVAVAHEQLYGQMIEGRVAECAR